MPRRGLENAKVELEAIKAEMTRQGIKQVQLADHAGASRSLVSAVFIGRRALSAGLRDKLRKALGMDDGDYADAREPGMAPGGDGPAPARPLAAVPTGELENMLDLGDQE